jgi:hypothetical protein
MAPHGAPPRTNRCDVMARISPQDQFNHSNDG